MTDPIHSHTESQADPRASRRSFLKLAGIGGAVLVAGCDTDEPDPVDPGEFGNLSGRVLSTLGDEPLAGVTISVEGTSRTTMTEEDGTYTFEDVPVGTYTIMARVANFVVEMETDVAIATGSPASIDFVLEPGQGAAIEFDFENDFGVLNYAYALEQLEAAFYAAIIADDAFSSTFSAEEQAILRDLAAHEGIHRDFLRTAIVEAGGTINARTLLPALTPNFEDIDFTDRRGVLLAARQLEELGVAAYNGAAEFISDDTELGPTYLLIAGKIVSVEGRHAAIINQLLNETLVATVGLIDANGLDRALAPNEALAELADTGLLVNEAEAINT